ncbi:MAG: hypothetical protein MZV64_60535 [Ignavibacteriales bacterium]|nr:hypothetical protein [Ignavibacteriales bacterium]
MADAIDCPINFGLADNPLRSSQIPKAKITTAPANTASMSLSSHRPVEEGHQGKSGKHQNPACKGVGRAWVL